MRVFAAIDIPERIRGRIADASKYFNFKGVMLVKSEALHITLHFFGEIRDSEVKEIEKEMDGLKMKPFGITLHGISFFKPHRIRVIYVGVSDGADKVTALYDKLAESLGIKNGEEFVPHATIARVRGIEDRRPFLELATEYEDYDFGTFTVDQIVLKSSTLTSGGPVYEELHKSKI